MRSFDVTVKLLILNSATEMLRQLGLGPVTEWLNVELPRVRNRRADLVGRKASGEIVHIEVQSENDPEMPIGMAEYALFILKRYKQYPQQLVLYVGDRQLRMNPSLEHPGMSFHYGQLDIRQLDGVKLFESAQLSDNVVALLTGLKDSTAGIGRVLRKIAKLRVGQRSDALALLFSAAELRGLEDTVRREVQKVPIILKTSINNKTFGPWIRKGTHQGAVRTVRLQLAKRFGILPAEVTRRLERLSAREVQQLAVAVLDARSLDELFPTKV